jgi:hypothetical protein
MHVVCHFHLPTQVQEQQRMEQAARSSAAISLLLSPESGLHDRLSHPMSQVRCISFFQVQFSHPFLFAA